MTKELYDIAAEETVVGLCLVDKAIWESVRAKLITRAFFTDRCRIVWESLVKCGWGETAKRDAAERLHFTFNVLDTMHFYASGWLEALIARAEEVDEMGQIWTDVIMERNLGTVLHLAKMRELIYQADRMQRKAMEPGVDLDATISDAVQRLSRFLPNALGGITSRPEYQGEM